jgi:hypothetical protein
VADEWVGSRGPDGGLHLLPVGDAVGHELDGTCVCGPTRHDFAPRRWLYEHERLLTALRGDT